MRYTVKCNECGRDFVAEAENYGTMKYRCPYCGNVLTCRFDPPKPSRHPSTGKKNERHACGKDTCHQYAY